MDGSLGGADHGCWQDILSWGGLQHPSQHLRLGLIGVQKSNRLSCVDQGRVKVIRWTRRDGAQLAATSLCFS